MESASRGILAKVKRAVIGSPDRKAALLLREYGMVSTAMRLFPVVIALLVAVSAAGAAAGEPMSGEDMRLTFRGMVLDGIYDDGTFFSETYFEDGSIRYHDSNGADSGEWSVSGETFCTFYEDQSGACFFVERDGQNCFTFYEAVEEGQGRMAPQREWTSRGWSRESPSTCPSPPGAEI